MKESIQLDGKMVIMKKYKLRRTGAQRASIEITVPKDAVQREARRLGISEDGAADRLLGVWKYGSFRGLHLDFEERGPDE